MKSYDPTTTEAKWQKRWAESRVYEADLAKAKKPFFTHVMFPYPSGDKLHVGHWYNYAPADSYARLKKMQGFDVFSPLGFDAFGLPAENYAIKTGVHPSKSIAENVKTMTQQLKRIGCMYDWGKSLNTSTLEYYRWTQWIFLQMFKNNLAERKKGNVNFCPSCQTVLANEQVWEGKCERCDSDVVQKPLTQWYLKITKYAERLLEGLKDLDWPEKTKIMQENWIGKKEGIDIMYEVVGTRRGIIDWNGQSRGMNSARPDNGDAYPGLKPGATDDGMGQSISPDDGMGQSVAGGFSRRFAHPHPPAGIHSRRIVHFTFTPKHRDAAFTMPALASRILRILDETAMRHNITIHEACAMPDHLHLLVSFDRIRDLNTDIIKKLKGASARKFLMTTENTNGSKSAGLWGEGAHHENIDSVDQFYTILHYIRKNPERAGIDPHDRLLSDLPLAITCFTTRPDTNFGATFLVLAPEHPFVQKIIQGDIASEQQTALSKYVEKTLKKTERERQEEERKKTGEFTDFFAINNLNGRKMPIWVSDFVLAGFGTGAVVGVPGHDARDFEFATTFGIPVLRVVIGPDGDTGDITHIDQVQEKAGTMVNSDFLDGMEIMKAKEKIMDHLAKEGWGKRVTTYRLRDWSIGRQRYWGALIPIVYDPEGNPHAIPEEHLPWVLPTDVEFKPTGTAPMAESRELKGRTEKIFGKGWTPEVDTMDTFVCSSFYSYMYLSTDGYGVKSEIRSFDKLRTKSEFVDKKIEKKWMPVQMYIGGAEHACMHLIYARFVGMALKDFGFVEHAEQYQKLVHQGVITNQGAKMSKSKGNVVSPDSFVERYGSDVFRMYLMFMGPFTEGGDWSDTGIKGIDRFVNRVHAFFTNPQNLQTPAGRSPAERDEGWSKPPNLLVPLLHRTIKKVTEDIESLHFNTAISALMVLLNEAEKAGSMSKEAAIIFVQLLAPMAPHLAEELWEALGQKGFVIESSWPNYDAGSIVEETFTLVVQVNGKVRADLTVPTGISKEEAIAKAKEQENVKKYLEGKTVKKEVYVVGKLVSLVI